VSAASRARLRELRGWPADGPPPGRDPRAPAHCGRDATAVELRATGEVVAWICEPCGASWHRGDPPPGARPVVRPRARRDLDEGLGGAAACFLVVFLCLLGLDGGWSWAGGVFFLLALGLAVVAAVERDTRP
jgi:hypothetical protein